MLTARLPDPAGNAYAATHAGQTVATVQGRSTIFISYRRSDAGGYTTAIRKTLLQQFGDEAIFRDVDNIEPGAEFPQTLRDELNRAAVVLAVIGKGWLLAANEYGQRRIDFEDDWVAVELSTALKESDVTVIPVLVDNAQMPPADALPRHLVGLATKNAVVLRHETWDETSARLLKRVSQVLRPSEASSPRSGQEEVIPNLIRQAVAEAFASVDHIGSQVLLATADDISRIVTTMATRDLRIDEEGVLELLLRRLVGRPVVRVAAYMGELLGNAFSYRSDEGNWLGYATSTSRSNYELDLTGCVLLLPGPSVDGRVAQVTGAAVAKFVNLDYYGASSNDPPGPYFSASGQIVQTGTKFSRS